jgi:hypothetical protein
MQFLAKNKMKVSYMILEKEIEHKIDYHNWNSIIYDTDKYLNEFNKFQLSGITE